MSGINVPEGTDTFLSALIVLLTGGIIAIANSYFIKKEIDGKRASTLFFGIVSIFLLFIFSWYNLIGAIISSRTIAELEANTINCGEAVTNLRTAVKWNPYMVSARYHLVECNKLLKRNDETLLVLEPLKEKLANDPDFWAQLALTYGYSNNSQGVHTSITRFLELPYDDIYWVSELLNTYMVRYDLAETEYLARTFISRHNNYLMGHFWLAWTLYEQGKNDEARANFVYCMEQFQDYDNKFYLGRSMAGLGFTYYKQNDNQNAKLWWLNSIQVYPDQEDVKNALLGVP